MEELKKREEYLNALEITLASEIATFFTNLESEILQLLDEEDMLNIITNNLAEEIVADHFEEYFDLILTYNVKAYENGNKYVSSIQNIRKKESIVMKAIKSINFNVSELFGYSDRVNTKLNTQTFKASASTIERVNDNINNVLSEGYRDGLGNKEIGKKLQKEFSGLKTHEATRIAVTEVNGAQSLGAYNEYDEDSYHQWLGAGDNRMRDTHRELDGEIVKVGTPFSNGLLHPGDRNGPIKEWIYCRCSDIPWICPYDMMVPPGMTRFRESDLIPIAVDEDTDLVIDEKPTSTEYPEGWYNLTSGEQEEYKMYMKLVDDEKMDKNNGLIQILKDKMNNVLKPKSKITKLNFSKTDQYKLFDPNNKISQIRDNKKLMKSINKFSDEFDNAPKENLRFFNSKGKTMYEEVGGGNIAPFHMIIIK